MAPRMRDDNDLGSSIALLRDVLRPVAWLGAQALLVLQPLLALLGADAAVDRLGHYLEHLDAPAPPAEEKPS